MACFGIFEQFLTKNLGYGHPIIYYDVEMYKNIMHVL